MSETNSNPESPFSNLIKEAGKFAEKIKDQVEDFAEKTMTDENKAKFEDFKKKASEKTQEFETKFKSTVNGLGDKVNEKMNYVKNDDFDELKKRVSSMEEKLDKILEKLA